MAGDRWTWQAFNIINHRMTVPRPIPPLWRVTLAFIAAPSLAAFAIACLWTGYGGLPDWWERIYRSTFLYLLFGLPQALLFGVPAYLLLRNRVRATLLNCSLAGATIASLPWLALNLLVRGPDYAFSGGHITDQNGHKTLAGWLDLATGIGWLALAGLFGGLVFWLVAVAGGTMQHREA